LDFSTITNSQQLSAALAGLNGGQASITGGNFVIVAAANTSDSIAINGTASTGLGLSNGTIAPTTGAVVNNAVRAAQAETDYNNLLTQINELARDASFNGNNLLQNDNLEIFFNENGTSSLIINGVDFDAAGLGLSAANVDDFQLNTNINAVLADLDTAILQIRTQASTFGSNLSVVETRQDFTASLINTLEVGSANLVVPIWSWPIPMKKAPIF